jgi:hypothetical protein
MEHSNYQGGSSATRSLSFMVTMGEDGDKVKRGWPEGLDEDKGEFILRRYTLTLKI